MKENLLNINKTKCRYLMDNANKFLDKTAITYAIPIEKGPTPDDSVDLNRIYKDIKITKRELIKNIDLTADALRSMGIRKGDIVTICSSNTPETIYMDYALNKIGAVSNYVYPNITSDEMKYFINEVNAKYLFILDEPNIRRMVIEACGDTGVKKIIASSVLESFPKLFQTIANSKNKEQKIHDDRIIEWKDFIKMGKENKGIAVECDYEENAISCLMHTSGTTSTPKAVMQCNKNINAIVRNYELANQNWIPGKKYLQVLPIFVSYGSSTFHVMFCANIDIIIIPEMNPKNFPGLVKKYHPNYLAATPSHWGALLKSKVITDKDLSYFEAIGTGGDGFASIEDRLLSYLRQHGCNKVVYDGYGSTEVSAVAVANLANNYKKGSLGKPVGKVNIGVFDPETGEKLEIDEVGEFAISGDTVTLGYYNDSETTKEVFRKHNDGQIWVHMGDLGKIDKDGFCHYEGRIKNVIARRSFKFSPSNEEKEIESIDNVLRCRIVAMPSKEEGQVPSAHIILDNYDLARDTLDLIIKHVNENIQELHRPVVYKIRKEIPKTKNNKDNLNALKIEDLATLMPGVLKSEISVINDENYDYGLVVEINPEIVQIDPTDIHGYVEKFIKEKMIEQKIARCNILLDVKCVDSKHQNQRKD